MKLSWILTLFLLVFVALFSVQNAEPITVQLLVWQITMSSALVILLATLLGVLAGIGMGFWSRRPVHDVNETQAEPAGENARPAEAHRVSAFEVARAMPPMP